MASFVQNMLDGIIGDGARSSKFECFINFADSRLISSERNIYALVKTSQFPGKSHDVIDLKFKGRTIPVKGQVKYDNTWTCTFYTTKDHELKKALEDWIESLDQQHNVMPVSEEVYAAQQKNNVIVGDGYTSTLRIAQMDFNGSDETIIYELYHCFPKSVSAIDVDYSSVGTISEFTVEFSYAYYTSKKAETSLLSIAEDLKTSSYMAISNLTASAKQRVSSAFNNLTGRAISSLHSEFNSSKKAFSEAADNMSTKIKW